MQPTNSTLTIECPNCGQHILVEQAYSGMSANCPNCNQVIDIPTFGPSPQRVVRAVAKIPVPAKPNLLGNGVLVCILVVMLLGGWWFGIEMPRRAAAQQRIKESLELESQRVAASAASSAALERELRQTEREGERERVQKIRRAEEESSMKAFSESEGKTFPLR